MNDAIDIPTIIADLLADCGSLDIAEAEFRRMMLDDAEIRTAYRQWCDDNDTTDRRGFADYAEEYLRDRESVWDSLRDYDDHD